MSSSKAVFGWLGAIWGISGLGMLFGNALFRLFPYVVELRELELQGGHWAALAASLVFLGYGKGYLVFQRKFSPRAAVRALYLKNNPTVVRVLLAPLFCLCFFCAIRKRMIMSYTITTMVVLLIIGVRQLDQPWRGIVDAGVVLGLGWGLATVIFFFMQVFFGKGSYASHEVPSPS